MRLETWTKMKKEDTAEENRRQEHNQELRSEVFVAREDSTQRKNRATMADADAFDRVGLVFLSLLIWFHLSLSLFSPKRTVINCSTLANPPPPTPHLVMTYYLNDPLYFIYNVL